jgi:hypothetical protein
MLSGLTLFPMANLNPVGIDFVVLVVDDNAGEEDVAMVDNDDDETGFVVVVVVAAVVVVVVVVVVVDGGNATIELPPANDRVPGRNLTEFGTGTVVVVVVGPSAPPPSILFVGVIPMDEPDNDALLRAIFAAM